MFAATAPSLVVNAAAYTAVDAAEDDADAAFRANRDGPAELARLCEAAGIPLIHVSTDYVFDGLKGAPYVETDPTAPQGVYGASKLAGEQAVLAACSRAIVLRTSWVYSPTGKNFVRTMLAAGQRNASCASSPTSVGCPTSAPDLAAAILGIAAGIAERRLAGPLRRRLPRRRERRDDLARPGDRDVRSGGAPRHGGADGRCRSRRRNGRPGKRPPDSRLDCGKLAGGVRPAPAALAGRRWRGPSMRSSPLQRSAERDRSSA